MLYRQKEEEIARRWYTTTRNPLSLCYICRKLLLKTASRNYKITSSTLLIDDSSVHSCKQYLYIEILYGKYSVLGQQQTTAEPILLDQLEQLL